jgi:hypothetical protein
MSMQLLQKEVILSEGGEKKILVSEAGWDYTFRFSEIEKTLEVYLADSNYNDTFKYFCKNYYSLMASCVVEGDLPTPQEAYALPRLYLDNWYLTVWELNEEIMGIPCPKDIQHEEINFRDGSKVYVWESHGLPSFVLKLVELENEAFAHPLEDDPQGQLFVSLFYPKMAASCNGSSDVPEATAVRSWPRGEINKWLEASRRLNPDWFKVVTEITPEAKEEVVKEKAKKARKRSGG